MTEESLPDFDNFWDYDDPAGTEMVFRELLPAAAADSAYRAELLTQIARTQALRRQFEQAHATLNELEQDLTEDLARVRVRYLLERGRVYNSSGKPEKARPLFDEALRLASQSGEEFHAVDAAHMIAILAPESEKLTWNNRALEMAEAAADPRARRWAASLQNNIGWTHFASGSYSEALEHFVQALELRQQAGNDRDILIARWCVAKALRVLERAEEALAIQRELERAYEAAGAPSGYVFEELAECLSQLNRSQEARPYYGRAYQILSQDPWLQEHESHRLERLRSLSGAPGTKSP